jgi:hypothetical protein
MLLSRFQIAVCNLQGIKTKINIQHLGTPHTIVDGWEFPQGGGGSRASFCMFLPHQSCLAGKSVPRYLESQWIDDACILHIFGQICRWRMWVTGLVAAVRSLHKWEGRSQKR